MMAHRFHRASRHALAFTTMLVSVSPAVSALAQQAVPAEAQAAGQPGGLTAPGQSAPGGPTSAVAPAPEQGGEIIVTANKRAENVQDVPLAVSVIAPAQLQSSGVREFQDLGKIAPALTVRPAQHPVNANISLRGVGTYAFGIGVESSVAVLVDEVPLAFQARAFSDLPDVERIEVLRGPQSTLYGKSASAGLINIITREPTSDLRVRANGTLTTDGEYGINGSVSGPLTDNLGYVVSAAYSDFDGLVRNVVLDRDVGGRESFNMRGKLRWDAADVLRLTLSGNYLKGNTALGRVTIRTSPTALYQNIPGQTPAVVFPGADLSDDTQDMAEDYFSHTNYEGGGGYLRAELDVGEHTLLSITSYDKYKLKDFTDQDYTAAPVPQGKNIEVGEFRSDLVTQEVRLLSPDGPFRYTLGGYFAKTNFGRDFQRGPSFSLAQWEATAGQRQFAGYVQADWELLEDLTLTGGARLQNEKIDYTFRDIRNGGAFFSGDADDTAFTWKGSARYQITPDIMVFGTYATGYKGQTYDLTTGFNQARANAGPIRPETSRNIEFGTRMQFLDRRVTLNLTYFDTDFEDLQAQSIEQVGVVQSFRLTNVGGLTTRGVEVDASARVGEDLTITGSAIYLHARYTDFPQAQCYGGQTAAQGCVFVPATPGQPAFSYQDLTGQRTPQAPDWKLSVNADYSPALSNTLRAVVQAAWQFQTDIRYTTNDPQTFQPSYHIVNLGLGVRDEDRRWEVVGFINNLFDQQYFPALENRNSYFGGSMSTNAILPRDFRRYGGIRVGLNF